jgi:hypothetical protein
LRYDDEGDDEDDCDTTIGNTMLTRKHQGRRFRPGFLLITAAGLLLAGPAAAARLEGAGPEEVARELERVVGVPVEIRGGVGRQVTLELAEGSPERQVERAAAALGGRWRLKLRVKPGRGGPGARLPVLERRLPVGFQDITARLAFSIIARDLKADLELEGDLPNRVTVLASGISTAEILNLIAEQAGAAWSVAYRIDAPDAPPRPQPAPPAEAPAPAEQPVSEPAPPPPPAPREERPPAVPPGPELRAALHDAMVRVLRTGPERREEAVRRFVREAEALFDSLARLAPSQRDVRIRTIYPILAPWKRLHQGLAPEVQKQMAPILEVLERHLRLF